MSFYNSQRGLFSSFLLRVFFIRDLFLGMFNLLFGRLNPSLLPKVSKNDLTGRVALITGGNSGIGFSIAKSLALKGCKVYLACRNLENAKAAAEEIEDIVNSRALAQDGKSAENDKSIRVLELDTSSFASVRKFADALATYQKSNSQKIDLLYHNAGISGAPAGTFSEDGHDLTYQTNFLSSFLLTYLLIAHNALSPSARIIFTTSTGQYGGKFSPALSSMGKKDALEKGFHCPPMSKTPSPSELYSNTKLMQVAFTKLLQRHLQAINFAVSVYAFTPAYCSTPIFSKAEAPSLSSDPVFYFLIGIGKISAIQVEEGAATGVWLADADIKVEDRGGYWDRCKRRISGADVMSEAMLKSLWERWCDDAGIEWNFA